MPNRNYLKGVRKERTIVNAARLKGHISFRSAGSHSPIDVIIIDRKEMKIHLIQCKPETMSENQKDKLRQSMQILNNPFLVDFMVV